MKSFKKWLESTVAIGQCFPYAIKFSLDMLNDGIVKEKDIFICHGNIIEPLSQNQKRYDHAWVEAKISNEERVYDWQMSLAKNSLKKSDFYELFDPQSIIRYSIKEAVKNCATTKHHGPWS